MRFSRVLLWLLALAAAPRAQAQQPYVDPDLRALLRPNVQAALRQAPALGPEVEPDRQPLAPAVALRKANRFDVARVGVFVKIRGEAALAELRAAGAIIGSRIGDIVTAEVPVDRLSAIFASPHFAIFEAARTVVVNNDTAMRVVRADAVRRAAAGTWTGTAGRGVIVGVYDTGIDYLHDDFVDAAGQTRVLGIWDQTDQAGTPPQGFSYGHFCSRSAIQQVVNTPTNTTACPQVDFNGHGSHVAGSAAGDGSAVGVGGTPFMFAGVAPLADLMIVKGGNGLFSESGVIDGLVWLEAESRRLDRPMVVNLSLGSQAGPHDGSRLYERAVDDLSRPGFVVVFSAGNEGSNGTDRNPDGSEPNRNLLYIHGSGSAGASRDFTIDIPPYTAQDGPCNDFANISLWYEGADMYSISVLRPDGGIVTAGFGDRREQDSPAGNVTIDNGSAGPNPLNNAHEAAIHINDCGSGTPPVAGLWTLRVSSVRSVSGKPYHFWMYAQSLGGGTLARGRLGFDNHHVVGSPGNARSAITVGAFATKVCWSSPAKPEGPVCFVTREAIGELARFSSAGPSRDGRLKPEITAPGLAIASVKARTSAPVGNRILADGVHSMNQGTSMAAPLVTGTIALMLELRPALTAADVRDVFSTTAVRDQFTTRVYDTSGDAEPRFWWGYGKLNACAALSALGGPVGGEAGPVVITPSADTLPINATVRFFSCSTGGTVTFRSTNTAVATIDNEGLVRALQVGSAQIIASAGAFADTARVVVTEPANLAITARNAAPDTVTRSPRGTQIPLLSTTLRADGFEAIRVTQLSYRISGSDPGARLLIIADVNRNGIIDVGERTIASQPFSVSQTTVQVDVALDTLVIPQRDSVTLIAALQLSGAAPNGAAFTAELVPAGIRSTGIRSLATNRLAVITTPLVSATAVTTVLAAGQSFSLSENPVRGTRVVFNFTGTPTTAGIYTLAGRLVADLTKRMALGGSIEWDLTNDDGDHVATGVYFVAFNFGGNVTREKLFVIRSGAN